AEFLAATIPKKPTWSERWTWAAPPAPQMSAHLYMFRLTWIKPVLAAPSVQGVKLFMAARLQGNSRCGDPRILQLERPGQPRPLTALTASKDSSCGRTWHARLLANELHVDGDSNAIHRAPSVSS